MSEIRSRHNLNIACEELKILPPSLLLSTRYDAFSSITFLFFLFSFYFIHLNLPSFYLFLHLSLLLCCCCCVLPCKLTFWRVQIRRRRRSMVVIMKFLGNWVKCAYTQKHCFSLVVFMQFFFQFSSLFISFYQMHFFSSFI